VVRLDLAYDGTGFRGWAAQRNERTIEGELRTALEKVLGAAPRLSVAGRTDAGCTPAVRSHRSSSMARPISLGCNGR